MLVLLLPHLDCIALPHCQPIGASPGSAYSLPFATDIASCPSLLLEHAARCMVRACSGWGGSGEVVEGEGWPSEPQAQQPLPSRTLSVMCMMLASQECNIPRVWAPLVG